MKNVELIVALKQELGVDVPEDISYHELKDQLASFINELIKNNFDKLIAYLYRIDVSEEKLKLMLHQFPGEDAGKIIASLIIERQEQKIKLRNQNKPGTDTDIPETEKW